MSHASSYKANAEQVQALSPLVPFFNPKASNLLSTLEKFQKALCNDTIRDFLVNDNAHLYVLTRPRNLQTAISLSIERREIESPVFSLNKTYTSLETATLIHAFDLDDLSAGIMISDNVNGAYKDLECRERIQSIDQLQQHHQRRFVYNAKDRSLLAFEDGGSFTNITLFISGSSFQCRRFDARLDRQPLLNILSHWSNTSRISSLLKCVRVCTLLDAYRNCPVCQSPPSNPCTCALPSISRQDQQPGITTLTSALFNILGSYSGMSHRLHFARGVHLQSKAYGCFSALKGCHNSQQVAPRLANAVVECVKDMTYNPWASVLPPAEDETTTSNEGDGSSGKRSEVALDARTRRELRVMRNREAARKSNLERKIKREERRRELAELRALQEQLMAYERKLKSENRALRDLVRDMNVKR